MAETAWPPAAAAAIKHDMVLLDLSMPDMGGQEALARMRKAGMNTTVIVISGMDFAEPAIETFRLGAVDYILKPVNFDEVLRRVAAALKAGPPPEGLVEFQELRMSRGKRLAWVNGRQAALTPSVAHGLTCDHSTIIARSDSGFHESFHESHWRRGRICNIIGSALFFAVRAGNNYKAV